MANTIRIPFDQGAVMCDRDQLATAILLRMEHNGNQRAIRAALIEQHNINPSDATYLTVAARICAERGIEP
ncbi:hypothetical protein ACGFIW_01475 [Micromonospora sp. NPDC048935]|uniref:hypothetical protein n=1 Tax=Micromonospora sp. NPDC048935 TaxID=3364262 RepID=UPI00372072BA